MGKRRILSRADDYILPSDLPSGKETAQTQPSSPDSASPDSTIKRPRPQQQHHLPSTPIQPLPLSQPSNLLPLTTAKSNGKQQQPHSFIDILQQLSNQQFSLLIINFNQRQNNNTNVTNTKFKIPIFAHKELDLQKLWWYVWKQGGYQAVTDAKQWKEVCRHVVCHVDDLKGQTSASYNMRQNYEKCLLEFEKYCSSGRFVVDYSEKVSPSTELIELAAAGGGGVGNRGKHTAAGKAAIQKRRMIKPRKLELASIQVDKEEKVPDDVIIRDDEINSTMALPSASLEPVERRGNKVNERAIMYGLTVDVLRLQELLHSYSKTSNQPISTLSAVTHKIIAYTTLIHAMKSLSLLTQEMESAHPDGTAADGATGMPTVKLSSGVSYVVESESMQQGVPGDPAPLPPLTIRPPNLIEVPSPKTESWTDCIMHGNKCSSSSSSSSSSSKVVVAVLPLKDENIMKRYLLSPSEREGMIKSNGGYFTTLKGVEEVVVDDNILRDKTFLCFHYKLVKKEDGDDDYDGDTATQLMACRPPPTPTTTTTTTTTTTKEEENCCYGNIVRESNVQVGIMVRKGVGGTCPLRAAAKGFHLNGLLAGLLDDFIVFVDEEEEMVVAEENPCMDVDSITTTEENNDGQKVEALTKVIDQVSNRDGNDDDDDDGRLFTDILLGPPSEEEQEEGERQKKKSSSDDEEDDEEEEGEVHDDEDDDEDDDKTRGSTESQQQQPKQRKNELVDEEGADALLEEMEQQQQQQEEEGEKTGVIAREPVERAANEPGLENVDVANDIDTNPGATTNNNQDLSPTITTTEIAEWQMPHHKLSLYTLSSRLELYCSEQLWSGLDRQTKCELYTVIRSVERQLLKMFTQSNHHRVLSRCIQLKEESIEADILSHPLSEAILLGRYDVPRYVGVTLNVLRKKKNEEEEEEEDYCEVIIQQAEEGGGGGGGEEEGEQEQEKGQVHKKKSESRALERYLLNQWTPSPTNFITTSPTNNPTSSTVVDDNVVMSFDQAMVALAACLVTIDHHQKSSATPWPFYLISTRDCFTYRLVALETKIESNGRKCVKTEYFFPEGEHPPEYNSVLVKAAANTATRQAAAASIVGNDGNDDKAAIKPVHQNNNNKEDDEVSSVMGDMLTMVQAKTKHPEGLLPVGITTYTQLFSLEELSEMELKANELQNKAESGSLPDCCFHTTASKSGGLKRTKYFFGARYLWTRDQLSAADSKVAGGVRADVPAVPQWMKRQVEQPLVQAGLLPRDWIDSIALNMYHDGSEGIQSHFDDAYRFERPIHSLRLFSDSRLSFGTQLYGYTNGAFVVPMPRGCMTVMEEGGFAADGMKHCVRPSDMSGKSAGMVLRRINPAAMQAAEEHMVDETSSWMQALSLDVSMRSEVLNAQREEQQQRILMLRQQRKASSSNGGTRDGGNSNGAGGPRIQKDVRRVMRSMIQRVIHNMKSEKRDRQTSKLMLISIVDKIEAACRMKMDLLPCSSSGTDAAEVFSLLSDMVSFVERSTPSPSRTISKPLSKPPPLQPLLVLGGRGGNRVLGNADSRRKRTPLKRHRNVNDDDDGLLIQRKIIKSSSGSTEGGNGKRTRGGFQLPVKSVFVVEKNNNVSEMMVVESGGGIDKFGGKERSDPSLVPTAAAAAAATSQVTPMPLPVAPNGTTTTSTSLLLPPPVAPKESPPINKQIKLPKPKPKLKQPPSTTPKSKPATFACYTCRKGIEDTRTPKDKEKDEEEEEQHWICTGPCLRSFHFSCTFPAVLGGFLGTRCSECSLGTHPCFVCGKGGPSNNNDNNNNTGDATIKCSMAKCGRYYHPRCVRSNKLAQFKSDKSFKCMAHYCAHCERSGDGVAMVQCISCPSAYHAKCKPSGGFQPITRKLIICPTCL